MRTFLRNIVATVVLLMSLIVNPAKGQTGSVYPVDLNVMLAPPFGTCLTDLTNTNRFVIQALLRDMNHGNDYQMVIQMRVKSLSSLNTVFLSHTKPFSIGMGKPTVVLSANNSTVSISDFFDEANILALPGSVRLNNNCLPEGSYMFCFQAFDAMAYFGGQRIPISKEFALTAFMEDGAAPILLSPRDNDMIPCMAPDINFMWQQPFVTSGLNTYTLQIAEVTDPSHDSPQVLETGNILEYKGLMVPMKNVNVTEAKFQKEHTYYWRVIMCDKNGTPRYNYPNKGASPAYRFVYCGTPQEPEPEDPWEQKVPKAKAIGKGLDTLRMDSVRVDKATTCTAIWFKDSVEVREKYDGVIIEVKKKTQDTWTPFKLESTVRTDTTIELSSLSYNDSFMVRGQYYMLEEGKPVYAPYSDTVYFRIKHPADTVDCGAPVPELTDCSGSGERSEFRLGDRFSANGTSVTIDSIISQKVNGSSLTLTGLGHIPFPILSNFGLKVSFTDVEINCDNQLKRGKVISVYDEKTAAMIDLNNLIGKGNKGNDLGQSDAILNDGDGDVSNLGEGDVILNGNNITMKDTAGNEISVGTVIDLSSSSVYSDNTSLKDSKVYIKFSNPDYENIAFDDDDQKLRNSSFTLADNYRDFGGGYIIPWVASNPGRKFQLKATPSDNFKTEGYTDVKFVIPASSGKHIELESEANGDDYMVSIPGISTNKQSTVYAIARKNADSPYENVGKLNLCCYTFKTKRLVIVPLVEGITVSASEVKTALEKIYGKLGYTFEVEVDNAHSNGVHKSIALESTVMSEFSSDMKEVINGYKANIDADASYSYDKSAAYLFLMEKPEGSFSETKGIMPQKQQFGFIFMQGSKSVATAETHTMAHELGHGLFGLDHVFIKSYGITEGTTHNLMDYTKNTPDDFLSYHEWSQINSPVMSWSLFNSDEGNMYKPWTFADTFIVNKLKDPSNKTGKFTFAVNDKEKIVVPAGTKRLTFDQRGYLVAFVDESNELWHSFWTTGNNPKFLGFYKDLKVSKIDANGERIYSRNNENKNYSVKPEDVEKDSVYMPIFEGEQCYVTTLYKVPTPQNTDISYRGLYKKIKGMTEEARIENDYCRLVDYEYEYYHCLPESVRTLYLFMTNYYDYFNDKNVSEEDLEERKSRLGILLMKFNTVKIHGLDNTENCFVESDLSSQKGFDVNSFMKEIEKKYYDILKSEEYQSDLYEEESNRKYAKLNLCITFDNYSVYQDFYLKQFSPVEKGEPVCSKEQWEKDMTTLEEIKNAVKNNENIKIEFPITKKKINKVPSVYDFCDYIVEMCHDYLHTVKYEIIENYLKFIVDECCKNHNDPLGDWENFKWVNFKKQFNTHAENASLHLMKAIDSKDLDKFAKYLAGEDSKYRVLTEYMSKFDDAMWDLFDDNGYTGFMRVLVTMFNSNPYAFGVPNDYKFKLENTLDGKDEFEVSYDEENGLVSLTVKDENGTIQKTKSFKNQSPFYPVYFAYSSEDAPSVVKETFDALKSGQDNILVLSCPAIFLKYYDKKVSNETAQKRVIAGVVVVGVGAAAVFAGPALVTTIASQGSQQAVRWIATKFGETAIKNFGVGAGIEAASYMIGLAISNMIPPSEDEFQVLDLLQHAVIGGLSNMFTNKYVKIGAACINGFDATAVFDCVLEVKDSGEFDMCIVKILSECIMSAGCEYLGNSEKIKNFLTGKAKNKVIAKLTEKFGPEMPLRLYAIANNVPNPMEWCDNLLKTIKEHGEDGLKLLSDVDFDLSKLSNDQFLSISKFMHYNPIITAYKEMKEILTKNNLDALKSDYLDFFGFLEICEVPRDYAFIINEMYKKLDEIPIVEKGKQFMLGEMLKNPSTYIEQLSKIDVLKQIGENTLLYRYKTAEKIIEVEIQSIGSAITVKTTDDIVDAFDKAIKWIKFSK